MSCNKSLKVSQNSYSILKVDSTDQKSKEGCYILVKQTIQLEQITIVSTHTPNTGTLKFIKHILLDTKRSDKHQCNYNGQPQ